MRDDVASPCGSALSEGLGPLLEPAAWANSSDLLSAKLGRERYGAQGACEQHTWREGGPTDYHGAALYTAEQVRKLMAAERERMIADGWRQTRYVAPVTDCEACLTPDACAIRGQCGHYLRERG